MRRKIDFLAVVCHAGPLRIADDNRERWSTVHLFGLTAFKCPVQYRFAGAIHDLNPGFIAKRQAQQPIPRY